MTGEVLPSTVGPTHLYRGALRPSAHGVDLPLAGQRLPEVRLVDEPVSALDAVVRPQVVASPSEARERQGAALPVVSYDFGVVCALRSDVVVLADGRVAGAGPVQRGLTEPDSAPGRALVAAALRLVLS